MTVFVAMERLMVFRGFSAFFRVPLGYPGVERQCHLVFDFQPVSCACG